MASNFITDLADVLLLDPDLPLSDAFRPILDILHKEVSDDPSLLEPQNYAYCAIMELFTKRPNLAEVCFHRVILASFTF